MKNRRKPFDAVSMMRKIRDRLSVRLRGMSFDDQARLIRKELNQSPSSKTPSRRSTRKTA